MKEGAPMDPEIWSNLSEDLLQLIFARLSLPQINRLRVLSKAWRRNMDSGESKFRKLCSQVRPHLFALITERDISSWNEDDFGKHPVHVYDTKSNEWHSHEINAFDYCKRFNVMNASDGGLVCLVCACLRRKTCRLLIVCNPLTHELRELPEHNIKGDLIMVQLVMDKNTKTYKVILVGFNRRGNYVAEFYDSVTQVWTTTTSSSDLIFGLCYRWEVPLAIAGPCAYDCSEGRLIETFLDKQWPKLQGHQNVHNYAMMKDRLYVLHKDKERKRYVISEFQGHKCEPHWTKVRDHECGIWGRRTRTHDWLALLACKDSLLVYAGKQEHWPYKPYLDARLYDLVTCEWRVLPELPEDRTWQKQEWMCELQWDVSP